jgi:hypothetical protein
VFVRWDVMRVDKMSVLFQQKETSVYFNINFQGACGSHNCITLGHVLLIVNFTEWEEDAGLQ